MRERERRGNCAATAVRKAARLRYVSCAACVKALLNSLPGMSCFEQGDKILRSNNWKRKDVINLVKSNATPIS